MTQTFRDLHDRSMFENVIHPGSSRSRAPGMTPDAGYDPSHHWWLSDKPGPRSIGSLRVLWGGGWGGDRRHDGWPQVTYLRSIALAWR